MLSDVYGYFYLLMKFLIELICLELGGSCDPQGSKCPAGYISFLVKSGQGKDQSPLVCFNGE